MITENEISQTIDGKIFEIEQEYYYLYFNQDKNELQAGTVCNTGFCALYAIPYDIRYSIDCNLMNLQEHILCNSNNQ